MEAGAVEEDAGSLRRQLEEADNDFANDEDYETTALEAVESASRHVAPLVAEEKALLKELRAFAVQGRLDVVS